eukprot:s184_g8.t2
MLTALRSSLLGLKHLGYPFKAPVTSDGSDGTDEEEGDDCVAVGKGRAGLLKSVKALAGFTRPGCQVLPVGSFAWGIDIEGSDLDVVVATGKSESDSDVLTAICHKLQMLQAKGKAPRGLEAAHCVVYGVGTSMPVLAIRTFQDGEPLDVDMCTVGNLSSVRDAILFRHYFELLPRLPEVLQLLKRWLRLRALPTSSEGGYPQIFWMRLAARTFQTVRQLLRGFCAQWSQSLPSWGSLMNLVGEEPSPFLKRLPAGVYGATALLFLRELTILSKTPTPEDLPRLPPQQHLCPAKAGFWAAFLIPALSDEAAEDPPGHSPVSGGSPPSSPLPKAKAKAKEEKKDEKKEALAAQAVKERLASTRLGPVLEILKAIEQPDVQKHGTFILPDWHTTYKDQLGSYKKFVKRSTQLQVIEMEEGKYIIQKAGDTTAAAVPQAKAKAAKGDWKQLLASAWNIYCQATARHEWNIDVFTSALARGVRTTKPVTGDSAPASPKVGPKDGPDEPKDNDAKADAEGPKKTLRKKGVKSKGGNEKAPDGYQQTTMGATSACSAEMTNTCDPASANDSDSRAGVLALELYHLSSSALLVSGRVTACVGQQETIRYCYARPEEASSQPRPEGKAQSAGIQRYEFISRKDSDWVMLVDVNWKELLQTLARKIKMNTAQLWQATAALVTGAAATAAFTGFIPFPFGQEEKPKEMDQTDDLEQRLQQELRTTSFTEWKASGFDPEAAGKPAAKSQLNDKKSGLLR